MKKRYIQNKHKRYNNRKSRKGVKKRDKNYIPSDEFVFPSANSLNDEYNYELNVPNIFVARKNLFECLLFFKNLRDTENAFYSNNRQFIRINMADISEIDYSTISILISIKDDLKSKGVFLKGLMPKKVECKKILEDSGFLNDLYDKRGRPFKQSKSSDIFFFKKGQNKITGEELENISRITKRIREHLTGSHSNIPFLYTLISEISGNSIEWSSASDNNWLLGVKYKEGEVIITLTDVGKGILRTLNRKYKSYIDILNLRNNKQILERAFEKKYGSKEGDQNRNKGLPYVRKKFKDGSIKELVIMTNNVILYFDSPETSIEFNKGTPWFKGTFYRWKVDKKSLNLN